MPPAAWISSSARSKPCFHCAPYCAFGPVNGPLTPSMMGSEDCASAPRDIAAPVTRAARDPLTKLRRLMFLICDSIRSETGNPPYRGNSHARGYRCDQALLPFVGSPSDSISLFAQLKNSALFITAPI